MRTNEEPAFPVPAKIANGTFLLVGSGESYFTEIVKGPDLVKRVLAATIEPPWSQDDIQYWSEAIWDEDSWSHDPDYGPVRYSVDIGETDHIEIIRIEPNEAS